MGSRGGAQGLQGFRGLKELWLKIIGYCVVTVWYETETQIAYISNNASCAVLVNSNYLYYQVAIICYFKCHQRRSFMLKMYQNRWRPGLRPGPRRGSSRRSPDPLVDWGGGLRKPLPDPTPLGASILAPSALDLGASNHCLSQGLNR